MKRICLLLSLFVVGLISASDAQQVLAPVATAHPEFSFSCGNFAAGSTSFCAPGTTGVNTNVGALISVNSTTMGNLYYRLTTAPAAAQSVVVTLYTGTAGSMSASSVTCTVAAATNTCNDTTHTAVVTAGQAWSVQVVAGATNATGAQMIGLTGTE